MLRSKLAPGTRCALEHGGVAPVIVAADADLDAAVPKLAKGGFYHAGQVCVSVQRVFAHRSIAEPLAERLAAGARTLVVGDPTLAETEVGPLIRHQEVERVDEWVQEAVDGGAQLLCGGKRLSATCYAPTVLLEPPADAKVSTARGVRPGGLRLRLRRPRRGDRAGQRAAVRVPGRGVHARPRHRDARLRAGSTPRR